MITQTRRRRSKQFSMAVGRFYRKLFRDCDCYTLSDWLQNRAPVFKQIDINASASCFDFLACSKVSCSISVMFSALIFTRAQRTFTIDISAERNVWLQLALRSFAIVRDYVETDLLAMVSDLRSAIRDGLQSYDNQP